MDSFLQDLRFGFRSLRKRPLFTSVAVLTLALGIGANTAVFSVVDAVLLRPLPYEEPERLALLWTNFGPDLPQNWVSGPELAEMRELSEAFESIGAVVPTTVAITEGGEPEQVGAAAASGTFFRALRARAALGRLFGPEDDRPSAEPVAVLGHGFWQRRFGSDPSIVGRTLVADGTAYRVVGVLEPGFRILHPDAQFPDRVEVWAPITPLFGIDYAEMPRGNHGFRAFGRLEPGVSLEQARADMDAVALRIQERSPDYYDFQGWGITVLSLHADLVEDVKPALLILLAAVGLVLLIACVNVANLQLTRAAAREREVAVRSALGAGRGRILRQLLTESLVLAAAGAVLGVLLAFGLVRGLVAVAPEALPLREAIGLDGRVLLFALGLTVLTALLFGLAPAFFSVRQSLVSSLKEGGRGATAGVQGRRVRAALVASEVALALVLLVGAGLMVRSLDALLDADPGYEAEGVLTLRVSLPGARYGDEDARAFWDELLRRIEGLPGVVSAGAISQLPLSGSYQSGTTAVDETRAVEPEGGFPFAAIEADRRWVSPGYFETMGVEVLSGRTFTRADGPDAPPVAMVDEEFARRFWPDGGAVGRRVSIGFGDDGPEWREVVGVVRHSRHYDPGSVGREQVYFPYPQMPVNTMYVAARTAGDPAGLAGAVRSEVWAIDPAQPVSDLRSMEGRVADAVAQPRFNLLLLGGFAAAALVLAAIGIYGVISYTVSQRVHEVGVRMALGASRGDVRSLFFRQGMAVVAVGLAVGVLAALALGRFVSGVLYAVSPADPMTYVGVALLLGAVAAAACVLPTARAVRVQPVSVLREE